MFTKSITTWTTVSSLVLISMSTNFCLGQVESPKKGQKITIPAGGSSEDYYMNLSTCDGTVISASDKAPGDYGASSMATSNNAILMGAPSNDNFNGVNSGALYLFQPVNGVWTQSQKFSPWPFLMAGDGFGSSVAMDGLYAVGGSRYADPNGDASGLIIPLHWSGNQLIVEQAITAWDGAAGDEFGQSVAISGDWMVVGAPFHTASGQPAAGTMYVYRRFGGAQGSWSWEQNLKLPTPSGFDTLGTSVAMLDNTFIAGATGANVNGNQDAGAVLVGEATLVSANPFFATWTTTKLTAPDAQPFDHFGASVALAGNLMYIAAPDAEVNGITNAGAIYVFAHQGPGPGVFQFLMRLEPSWASNARVGKTMTTDGSRLLVSDANGNVYRYRDADTWPVIEGIQPKPANASPAYGCSLGIAGTVMAVGDLSYSFTPSGSEGAAFILNPTDNDNCVNAFAITQGSYTGCTFTATNDGVSTCAGGGHAPDVWYKLVGTPANQGPWRVSLRSNYDSAVSIHTGCPGAVANSIACDDDSNGNFDARAHFNVTAGQTYLIRVNGFASLSGAFELTARKNTCAADISPEPMGDGVVNVSDLLQVINSWNFEGVADIAPAPDGDNTTNVSDLLAVINAWGTCP